MFTYVSHRQSPNHPTFTPVIEVCVTTYLPDPMDMYIFRAIEGRDGLDKMLIEQMGSAMLEIMKKHYPANF